MGKKASCSRSRELRKGRTSSKFEEHSTTATEEHLLMPRLPLPQPAVPHVPDWMSDLVPDKPKSNAAHGFKALTIMATQVGHLIGPNGSGITAIRRASGADIKIDHGRGKAYGTVTITGNVDLAERLIYEKLATGPQSNVLLALR